MELFYKIAKSSYLKSNGTPIGKLIRTFRVDVVIATCYDNSLILIDNTPLIINKNPVKIMKQPVFKGQIPYGYRIGLFGEIQAYDQEQQVLEKIRLMRESSMNYEQISRVLNDNNIPAKHGGKWHPRTIGKIISLSELY